MKGLKTGRLVGDHLLLRDFEHYGIIFMTLCVSVLDSHQSSLAVY
jgi:hypothetical protein